MSEFQYAGSELELFAKVVNWKTYWASQCKQFIHGDVLEVGAGIGASTQLMIDAPHDSWTCLEPDAALASRLRERIDGDASLHSCDVVGGTIEELGGTARFDTIIYVDVLEHIEDDVTEIEGAASLLRQGGRLLVLAPAYQSLFTPFDAAIGHYRRYHRRDLERLQVDSLRVAAVKYLDSVGMLAALANRMLLRQPMPSSGQLAFWDSVMIPCSRVVDRIVLHLFGKSIFFVWERV